MKRKLLIMVFALGLILLVGCGQKFINSGDTESRYAYGWIENKDGTITVRIKDKWDKDCVWKAECDDEVLYCESGKKDGSFVVSSYNAGVGELALRLYRQEQEDWEYSLLFSFRGNGSGGVMLMSNTHEEPLQEGSYQYAEQDTSAVLTINTAHLWLWRDMGEELRTDKIYNDEKIAQFEISANSGAARDAMVQIYDTQAPLMLTIHADIDESGVVHITRIEESSDTEYGEENVQAFWKQLGFTVPISDAVEIQSANVVNDDADGLYAVGEIKVKIEEKVYDLYVSLLPRIVELSIPEWKVDPETWEWIPVNVTEKTIGVETVQFYQQESDVTAIWKQLGCNYVLRDRTEDVSATERAVALLMGVSENG